MDSQRARGSQRERAAYYGCLLLLVVLALAALLPFKQVARYQAKPSEFEEKALGTSEEVFLAPGIVVQRWSLIQLLSAKRRLEKSRDSCTSSCIATVTDPKSIRYAVPFEPEAGFLSQVVDLFRPKRRQYPLTVELNDPTSAIGNVTGMYAILESKGYISVSLPGLPELTIVRDKLHQPGDAAPTVPTSGETWTGRLDDRSGDALVSVNPQTQTIAMVIYRADDTIIVLPSRRSKGKYELNVQLPPTAATRRAAGERASTGAPNGYRDMCNESMSDRALRADADAWTVMGGILQGSPAPPNEWCDKPKELPSQLKRWPQLLQRYQRWDKEICKQCLSGLHAYHHTAESSVVKVLPVVSTLLLDQNGQNTTLESALKLAEQHVNSVLRTSYIKGEFQFIAPFVPIRLEDGAATEQQRVKGDLLLYYRAARRLGPNLNHAGAWAPYRELAYLRQRHDADLVVLITQADIAAEVDGSASRIPASQEMFFTVIRAGGAFELSRGTGADNIAGNATLAHELMHLVGANHQLQESGQRLPPSSHGMTFELAPRGHDARRVGTIETQDVQRLPFVSDACGVCGSVNVGEAWTMDSRAVVESEMARISRFAEERAAYRATIREPVCEDYASEQPVAVHALAKVEINVCAQTERRHSIFTFELSAEQLTEPDRLLDCLPDLIRRYEKEDDRLSAARLPLRAALVVAGYADRSGFERTNVGLSWARANNAAALIRDAVKKNSVYASKQIPIHACYYGISRPLCVESPAHSDDTEKCHQANRRIEVSIVSIPAE